MKIVYRGPQSLVEIHGIGTFERGKAIDVKDDKIARILVGQDEFEIAREVKPKGDEE